MHINDHLIESLAKGDIQVKHTRKPEDEKLLNVILCLAFPEDMSPGCNYIYYFKDLKSNYNWYSFSNRPKKDLKVVDQKFFFHPQGHKF